MPRTAHQALETRPEPMHKLRSCSCEQRMVRQGRPLLLRPRGGPGSSIGARATSSHASHCRCRHCLVRDACELLARTRLVPCQARMAHLTPSILSIVGGARGHCGPATRQGPTEAPLLMSLHGQCGPATRQGSTEAPWLLMSLPVQPLCRQARRHAHQSSRPRQRRAVGGRRGANGNEAEIMPATASAPLR